MKSHRFVQWWIRWRFERRLVFGFVGLVLLPSAVEMYPRLMAVWLPAGGALLWTFVVSFYNVVDWDSGRHP
ncbi:MAG TPA: hypothetical protein VIM58_05285 [Candidatus Methylacidiphilales bacterium]